MGLFEALAVFVFWLAASCAFGWLVGQVIKLGEKPPPSPHPVWMKEYRERRN